MIGASQALPKPNKWLLRPILTNRSAPYQEHKCADWRAMCLVCERSKPALRARRCVENIYRLSSSARPAARKKQGSTPTHIRSAPQSEYSLGFGLCNRSCHAALEHSNSAHSTAETKLTIVGPSKMHVAIRAAWASRTKRNICDVQRQFFGPTHV